jgi:saccharopine dehydrogenase-like NADP-dependent oxidoreductase
MKRPREAGIIILNELGLDPGIDHMGAMRIIDHVHSKGGKIEEFYSICGALPAPEAADNPFKYKFSWSPKGVVMAGNNDGNYLRHGKHVYVPTEDLFKNPLSVNFPEVGKLEIYPNRDSMPYINLYGIPETKTMMRGTFRHPGWCESLDAMKAMKLITSDKHDFTDKTYADFVAMMIGAESSENIRQKTAEFLGVDEKAYALDAIEWLGLFSNEPMNRGEDTPFEITSDVMIAKMELGRDERDMVVMQHVFLASYPDGNQEVIKSSMLDFGTLATDTAVARTVALPAAIGVEMILKGEITEKGVHIPVIPGIYNPILDRLEDMNIRMVEEFGLPASENIS